MVLRMIFRFTLLALALNAGPALAAANGVDELQRFYDRLQDLQTKFEQVQYDDMGGIAQKSSGEFILARPDRFRWEYVLPYKQSMVSDGQTFWFYDVDLAQLTKRTAANALQGTPALLLSGGPGLKQQFGLEDRGEKEGVAWVRLIPKAKEGDFVQIDLGLRDGLPRMMELRDNLGQTTRITFTDVKLNPGLKPGSFAFKMPAGVEVVDGDAQAVSQPLPPKPTPGKTGQ